MLRLNWNCTQTPAAEIICCIHEELIDFIEPLNSSFNDKNIDKATAKNLFFKFSSMLNNEFEHMYELQPACLNKLLDYFCIYGDTYWRFYLQ